MSFLIKAILRCKNDCPVLCYEDILTIFLMPCPFITQPRNGFRFSENLTTTILNTVPEAGSSPYAAPLSPVYTQ